MNEVLEDILYKHCGSAVSIITKYSVGGGSINDAYKLETSGGTFFLKTNSADRYPSMFEAESLSLKELRNANCLRIPEVIAVGESEGEAFLLMEYVPSGLKTVMFWEAFGEGLAHQHECTNEHYGYSSNNFIGNLSQLNTFEESWATFFICNRLDPMIRMGRDNGRLSDADAIRFQRLFTRLEDLIPKESPALLHGDLWSGNYICSENAEPYIIDPAVYYGHREMDVAMSKLFGGFAEEFYEAYMRSAPLQSGWENRAEIHNLYPLLVHLVLFGGSYALQISQILKKYV